jgi:hypothetical protein
MELGEPGEPSTSSAQSLDNTRDTVPIAWSKSSSNEPPLRASRPRLAISSCFSKLRRASASASRRALISTPILTSILGQEVALRF